MNLRYFTEEQFQALNPTKIPSHVAIIPDGNRRWAKNKQMNPSKGHEESALTLVDIACAAKDLGVKTITLYLFSTENWSRPQEEIDALMLLLHLFLIDECPRLVQEGIRLETIGDYTKFPSFVVETIEKTKNATAQGQSLNAVLALNYGGRDEICRAVKKIAHQVQKGDLVAEEVSPLLIAKELDTAPYGDPELLIRTSGELRLSNFLLWQISYAEIYVTNVLWPDFRPQHLYEAVLSYQSRERRLGGV